MPVTCPKCGYEHQPPDSASSAECPRCRLILSKKSLASQEQKLKINEEAKGWFRGEPIEEAAVAVETEPKAQLASPSLAKSKTKNCLSCNGVVAIGAKSCPHCGRQNPAPKPTSRFVLLLAGLLLLGFLVMLANEQRSTSSNPRADAASRLEAYGRSRAYPEFCV